MGLLACVVDRVAVPPHPANASTATHTNAAGSLRDPFIRTRESGSAGYDPRMTADPVLVLQIPRDSPLAGALAAEPPAAVAAGEAIVEHGPVDDKGVLEPPAAGRVVLTVPSPEALGRESDQVRRVLTHRASGEGPLVVVVEDAEELRDEELAPIVEAARRAKPPVILRVIRGG